MKISAEQIIELSHPLLNGRENFIFEAKLGEESRLWPVDSWYIECIATLAAHAGTHVEVPYHHQLDGADCMTFPVQNLIGEATVISCLGKKPGDPITLDDVMKAEGHIEDGDIVFLHTGYDDYFRSSNWQPYPYLSQEALDWLLQYHPKVIGTDASGVEIPDGYDEEGRMNELYGEPIHVTCFKNNIAIVESLTNLGAIENNRVTVFILSLPMQGMDGSPVRIVAIKDL
ncbi:MAG: cyclase family protein [Clostridia bacterium]